MFFSHRFPTSFQMATLVSPIPRSTVIWFGSLEFMSTDFGYDMILLSVKGPGGARVAPAQLRAPRRPHHHASPPKKRRGQRRHHSSASSRSLARARRTTVQESTALRAEAAVTAAPRHDGRTATPGDNAPHVLPPSITLLPHGLFTPRRKLPFGLDNAVASLARMICPNAQTYVERPMVLPRDAGTQQQAAELPDFSQVRGLRRLGPGRYTITSLRLRLAEEGRGCFYAAKPDPDSESDSYDPTRECFNIDGEAETTDKTQDAVAGGRAPVAREDPRTPRNNDQVDPPPQEDKAAQLAQLREFKAKLDEDRERLAQLERVLEQDQPYPHGGGAADGLERYTDRLSGTGNQNNPSAASPEWARTSWQRPCCYVTCLNPRTPKRGASEMRCKLCFKWRQLSNRPLEERRQRLSKTTPTVISGDTMHGTTSTSIVGVDMGMQRSAATALTAAGDTTATRTGWPQNHWALACSAEQSAARRCPARFDPRLALLNTTAKPSQNCGWWTSD